MNLSRRFASFLFDLAGDLLRAQARQNKLERGIERATGERDWTGTATARVIDGDTLKLEELDITVRLARVDAPETDEPGGEAATRALKRVLENAEVMDVTIRAEGKYQRAIAEVEVDGTNLSDLLLKRGLAERY